MYGHGTWSKYTLALYGSLRNSAISSATAGPFTEGIVTRASAFDLIKGLNGLISVLLDRLNLSLIATLDREWGIFILFASGYYNIIE